MPLLGGEQVDLQQETDGECRDAVQQRPAEQIAEARRAQRAGEDVRDRPFGGERFNAGQCGLGLVYRPLACADFAGDGVHRVDAAQVHAAQRHMAHEAQRVVCALALGGENAVGDDVDVVIRHAVGAEDSDHCLLHAEDFGAVFEQDAAGVTGELQRLAMLIHNGLPKMV